MAREGMVAKAGHDNRTGLWGIDMGNIYGTLLEQYVSICRLEEQTIRSEHNSAT